MWLSATTGANVSPGGVWSRAVGERATTDRGGVAIRARLLLVALGAWSIAPPYLGPLIGLELDVADRVEFVDHVLPGAVVVVLGLVALTLARAGRADGMPCLAATGACLLGALWSATSHAPLWLDAGQPQTPWGAVLLHATAGPLMAALSLWLLSRPAGGS